jgi:hypothetical protein
LGRVGNLRGCLSQETGAMKPDPTLQPTIFYDSDMPSYLLVQIYCEQEFYRILTILRIVSKDVVVKLKLKWQ